MALSSQRGRFHARSGSPSGWRRRRRAKAMRRAAGVVILAGLAITLFVWRPWSSALGGTEAPMTPASNAPDAAPAQEETSGEVAQDTLALMNDISTDLPEATPPAQADESPVVEERAETAAPQTEPVAMTMGQPLTGAAPTNAIQTPQREEIAQPVNTVAAAPERSGLDLSLQRLETTPTTPRNSANRSGLTFTSPEPVRSILEEAVAAQQRNDPVVARALFNRALFDPRITPRDSDLTRERMSALNQLLLFSTTVVPSDPLTETYVIRSGDSLSKIAAQNKLGIDWRLLQRVNRISDPRRIRIGQSLKLVRGPFHAVVQKRAYRIDLFAQMPEGSSEPLMFVDSFRVGLGEHDSTPAGSWVVRRNSRLINPPWTNPRTGEYFSEDNPENPIGERWVGLEGVDATTSSIQGIGIHGTIEPESIGQQASMGCIRMLDDDVALAYELLTEGVSRVEILP